MARIFGHDVAPDHELESRLAAAEALGTAASCIAETWRHDWRVCPNREGAAVGHLCEDGADPVLRAAYGTYYRTCICHGAPPEYCDGVNGSNCVSDFHRETPFCRVICLNHFREAAAESIPDVEATNPTEWNSWLDDQIEPGGVRAPDAALRGFLGDLFAAWNDWSGQDERPTWVSFWNEVEPLLGGEGWADRVRDALGLGGYGVGHWLVLLRYAVEEVDRYYRPSCLDAGWQPFHMVSPPGEPVGYAMNLSSGKAACCPEAIHLPIRLDVEHWTGYIGRTTTSQDEADLSAVRRRHYKRLKRLFPGAGAAWLPADPV